MKILNLIWLLAVLIAPAALASSPWEKISVWNAVKTESYSFEGTIKAIIVDENEHRILVKVETAPNHVETVKICDQSATSDLVSFEQSTKMSLMRQAFESGRTVKVGYESVFDRCLSSIAYRGASL